MRNHAFTRLKTLITATVASLYTKRRKAAKPKYRLDPERAPVDGTDYWLFESDASAQQARAQFGKGIDRLSDTLSTLRETLDLMNGVTPFPTQALTERPCARVLHDRDLFDGEPAPLHHGQDTLIGGASDFLFEQDVRAEAQQQAA
ncbi:MAG: hypothetical protein AAGH90_08305 [Pseudomonadota bacterium]